jgi:hypothetical protein
MPGTETEARLEKLGDAVMRQTGEIAWMRNML